MHEAAAGVCSADTFSPRLGMKAAQLASSNPPWRYLGRADILQNNLEVTGYNPRGFCLTCISCLLVHTRLFPPPRLLSTSSPNLPSASQFHLFDVMWGWRLRLRAVTKHGEPGRCAAEYSWPSCIAVCASRFGLGGAVRASRPKPLAAAGGEGSGEAAPSAETLAASACSRLRLRDLLPKQVSSSPEPIPGGGGESPFTILLLN